MHKKILAICAALVALGALAIAPAMASAATLKDTNALGETATVLTGEKIVADSTGVSVFEASGLKVECNENIMTGTVAQNNGSEVQGTIEDAWFQSKLNASGTLCASSSGATTIKIPGLTNGGGTSHWCIRTVPKSDNWELWGNNCGTTVGTGALTFIIENSLGTCLYTRSAAVTGTFNTAGTTHEALTLTLSGEPAFTRETGSGILCPAEGKLKNFVFDMYTDTGTTSGTYGNQPTAAPVFITNP